MQVAPGVIDGVEVFTLTCHNDSRGDFTEDLRLDWTATPMVQSNISRSRAGVLRGMHFHRRQADYWTLAHGMAFVALYDLRLDSNTMGSRSIYVWDAAEITTGLYIPPGVAHGFYAMSSMVLHYMVDRYYDGTDENEVRYDDPEMGIDWPSNIPIVSERDRNAPWLSQVELPRVLR